MERETLMVEIGVIYRLSEEETLSKFRGYSYERLDLIKKYGLKGYSLKEAVEWSKIGYLVNL